jgi:GNAT superfamily N-acetyltransferase
MENIQIVFASHESVDLGRLLSWLEREFTKLDWTFPEDPVELGIFPRSQTDGERVSIPFALVAFLNSEYVGFCTVDFSIQPMCYELGNYWLCNLVVGEKYRRRGIGSQLVQASVERAKGIITHSELTTIPRILLETPDRKHWYEQLGWKEIGFVRRGTNDFPLMVKYL